MQNSTISRNKVCFLILIALQSIFSIFVFCFLYFAHFPIVNQYSFTLSSSHTFIFLGTILMTFTIIIGIIAVSKQKYSLLYIRQIISLFCLLAIFSFFIFLFSTSLANKNCFHPTTYFQYTMKRTNQRAVDLLCSESCSCQEYKRVQECPGWISTPYDTMFESLQKNLQCSGWCEINKKRKYTFIEDGVGKGQECFEEWYIWVEKERRVILICCGLMVMLTVLFENMISYLHLKSQKK